MAHGQWCKEMEQTYISELAQHVSEEVLIKGWCFNKRSSGKIHFLQLRDGTGFVQGVLVQGEVDDDIFERGGTVTIESSVMVRGIVQKDERAPSGYELSVTDLEIIQLAEDYPIGKKQHGVGFLMEKRHLAIRHRRPSAILRVRSEVVQAARDYFYNEGYTLFDAPILTPNACEGTSTLFALNYFGHEAFLSQSGQLYGEAGAMAFGKVVVFGPSFRAEKSKTRRHLTEYWHVEPEVAYLDLDENMRLQEDMLCYIIDRILQRCRHELKEVNRDVSKLEVVRPPFPRLHYDEAVRVLNESGQKFEWGGDFGSPDETLLAAKFDRPFFVHHFPRGVKAFYMAPDPDDERCSLSVDCLAPEGYGEIIGGGQRAEDYDYLVKQIEKHGLNIDDYQWYLDLRRYGTCPHGGYGLGIERLVAWVCGIDHIRETIPFPRTIDRISP
jgi:asparaginyl-tRNA synthetase